MAPVQAAPNDGCSFSALGAYRVVVAYIVKVESRRWNNDMAVMIVKATRSVGRNLKKVVIGGIDWPQSRQFMRLFLAL